MIVGLSLLVCVVGFLFYMLSGNPKVSEGGRIAFAMGLLAFLLQVREVVNLLGTG